MGEVVAFRAPGRTARKDLEPPTGGAQILFFLGVRYERQEESQGPQDAASPDEREGRGPRGGKKRKARARA
jgi:hypothetical protein